MSENQPVVEEAIKVEETPKTEAPKESPAKDLRDIQALVVSGIFPGNMAPAVMRAYQLLDVMAKEVENAASK